MIPAVKNLQVITACQRSHRQDFLSHHQEMLGPVIQHVTGFFIRDWDLVPLAKSVSGIRGRNLVDFKSITSRII